MVISRNVNTQSTENQFMSKAKLKKHLLSLTKEQITDIVLELYDARKEAKDYLIKAAFGNLENGGRGIGNIVEKDFINPLSRYLFDNKIQSGSTLNVNGIVVDNSIISLECDVG